MRLNIRYKSKPKGKTEKQKRANAEKKEKIRISSHYNDTKPFTVNEMTADLTVLTYGAILSHDATFLEVEEDGKVKRIYFEDSWVELIIFLISSLIDRYGSKFKEKLVYYGVTSQTFTVDKVYGKYTFDDRMQYKVYSIYNTGYYLEAIFNVENIFQAILGLAKCCDISLNEFKIGLSKKKEYRDISERNNLLKEEVIVSIDDVTSMINDGRQLSRVEIDGVDIAVDRLDIVLWHFCNFMFEQVGLIKLLDLECCNETGISLFKGEYSAQIRGSNAYLYTDGNNEDIIMFIINSMDELNLDEDIIKFKFKALRNKKEWELD